MSDIGNNGLKISIMAVAVLSCLFSGYIIVSYFYFKDLQERVFMTIIFYISCADFLMNSTTFIGFPASGSVLCWLQGTRKSIAEMLFLKFSLSDNDSHYLITCY